MSTRPRVLPPWLPGMPLPVPAGQPLKLPYSGAMQVVDRYRRDALLFNSEWALSYTVENNPDVRFHDAL